MILVRPPLPRRRRAGEQAVAPFRALAEPLVDTVAPVRYQELLPPGDSGPHLTGAHRTMFLDDVVATAFAHRTSRLLANVAALSESPDELPARQAWVVGDEGQARVREAYPAPTWQRLTETKRRYDPTKMFRLNQNIPPA